MHRKQMLRLIALSAVVFGIGACAKCDLANAVIKCAWTPKTAATGRTLECNNHGDRFRVDTTGVGEGG